MNSYRAIIRIVGKRGNILFFNIPDWDNEDSEFSTEVSEDIASRIEVGHMCFAKYILDEKREIVGFKDWEVIRQWTDKELNDMWDKMVNKNE